MLAAFPLIAMPGIGVLYGAPFLAVAVGIRAKQPGAAAAGLLCLGVLPVAILTTRGVFPPVGLLDLLFAFLYVRSLRALLRYHAIVSPESSVPPGRLSVRWILLPPLLLSLVSFPILISIHVIPTGSMEESLLIGDHVVAERASAWNGRALRRGDIIIFRYPIDLSQTFVFRVVGVPGDRLRLINKQVYLNGKLIEEPYVIHKTPYMDAYRDNFPSSPNTQVYEPALDMLDNHVVDQEVVVPPRKYFAMGDNRDLSLDSRYWGFVPHENIIGKPLVIYWSYDAPTERLQDSTISLAHLQDLVLNFFTRTRWTRTFQLIHPYALSDKAAEQADATAQFNLGLPVNPKDGLGYVWIPPGTFQMGCVSHDTQCDQDENPRHPVEISKGFWMGRTEVPVGVYKQFVSKTGDIFELPEKSPDSNPGWKEDTHPIVNVSWWDAKAYCEWAGGRLPSEAEWEYAARGGKEGQKYPSGNGITHNDANFRGTDDNWEKIAPVGSFPPNDHGLYDMAGNVWEWVADWYEEDHYSSLPEDSSSLDPFNELGQPQRVLRGGSWIDYPDGLRSSNRFGHRPEHSRNFIGFRCAREVLSSHP